MDGKTNISIGVSKPREYINICHVFVGDSNIICK